MLIYGSEECLSERIAIMGVNDKNGVLRRLPEMGGVTLELGCGSKKKMADAIGVDALDYECVDIVGDVFEVLKEFPAQSIDAVYSAHFFEHVADLSLLLDEIARVLKDGGRLEIVVPHFSNPYFYSDYTHRTFFGLYTLCYFASKSPFRRAVPTYQKTIRYEIARIDLVFRSTKPFFVRKVIKKVFGALFNMNNYMKELYEENFCYMFPCYEVRYEMNKVR
jgi:ubiquinone/menaquinone biosynthesis C-methylase UbiE